MQNPAEINNYSILGISRSDTQENIQTVFGIIKRRLSSDESKRGSNDNESARVNYEAEKMLKAVTEAYECLADPNKKRVYDLALDGSSLQFTGTEPVEVCFTVAEALLLFNPLSLPYNAACLEACIEDLPIAIHHQYFSSNSASLPKQHRVALEEARKVVTSTFDASAGTVTLRAPFSEDAIIYFQTFLIPKLRREFFYQLHTAVENKVKQKDKNQQLITREPHFHYDALRLTLGDVKLSEFIDEFTSLIRQGNRSLFSHPETLPYLDEFEAIATAVFGFSQDASKYLASRIVKAYLETKEKKAKTVFLTVSRRRKVFLKDTYSLAVTFSTQQVCDDFINALNVHRGENAKSVEQYERSEKALYIPFSDNSKAEQQIKEACFELLFLTEVDLAFFAAALDRFWGLSDMGITIIFTGEQDKTRLKVNHPDFFTLPEPTPFKCKYLSKHKFATQGSSVAPALTLSTSEKKEEHKLVKFLKEHPSALIPEVDPSSPTQARSFNVQFTTYEHAEKFADMLLDKLGIGTRHDSSKKNPKWVYWDRGHQYRVVLTNQEMNSVRGISSAINTDMSQISSLFQTPSLIEKQVGRAFSFFCHISKTTAADGVKQFFYHFYNRDYAETAFSSERLRNNLTTTDLQGTVPGTRYTVGPFAESENLETLHSLVPTSEKSPDEKTADCVLL